MSQGGERGDDARLSLAVPSAVERTEIVIGAGAIARLGELLREHAPAHAYAVIADAAVAGAHGDRVLSTIEDAGLRAELLAFEGGEASKTPATWAELLEELVRRGFGRDACVIGLGGGVATDLAGFVAATFMRGVPAVHVPTSLVAMIDAALGGKTGVDLRGGKNLAGAFHQPRLVVADPEALGTLPPAELRHGLAEAIKHGAIANADYLDSVVESMEGILRRDPGPLSDLVLGSVRIKAAVVAEDALEHGARATLNFGHTIGHALETLTEYRVPHGQAVAMGMVVEAVLGEAVGVTRSGTADSLRRALQAARLPTRLPDLEPSDLVAAASSDKKARRGATRYALLRGIGEAARGPDGWTHEVPEAAVREAVAASRTPAAPSG